MHINIINFMNYKFIFHTFFSHKISSLYEIFTIVVTLLTTDDRFRKYINNKSEFYRLSMLGQSVTRGTRLKTIITTSKQREK